MQIGFEVFLTVCEEMSITKAAKRLYITQQAASDHIRRLEKQYGVTLFHRKPEFTLTDEGRSMRKSLQSIRVLEINMERNLQHYADGTKGSFKVGISTSRAPVILPLILPEFTKEYPLVTISFDEEDTQILEERLRQGQIDLFIGVNTTSDASFSIKTLTLDEIMLVISEDLLYQTFERKQFMDNQGKIDLRKFTEVPFVLPNFETGKVNKVIHEYLDSYHVRLQSQYNISDTATQLGICSTGKWAALCPRMLLKYGRFQPLHNDKKILIMSVKDFTGNLRIDLVTHKKVDYPPYIHRFMELLEEKIKTLGIGQDSN